MGTIVAVRPCTKRNRPIVKKCFSNYRACGGREALGALIDGSRAPRLLFAGVRQAGGFAAPDPPLFAPCGGFLAAPVRQITSFVQFAGFGKENGMRITALRGKRPCRKSTYTQNASPRRMDDAIMPSPRKPGTRRTGKKAGGEGTWGDTPGGPFLYHESRFHFHESMTHKSTHDCEWLTNAPEFPHPAAESENALESGFPGRILLL